MSVTYGMHDIYLHKIYRFKGSTLEVIGVIPQDGQWSIIGGMGEFTMARGVVDHKIVPGKGVDGVSRIYELNIHVVYTPMGSSAVSSMSCTP